jgi:NUMOD3 motif
MARKRGPLSPEHRAKVSASLKARAAADPEGREKARAWQLGKKLSPETRAKMSAARKGKKHSVEWVAARKAAMADPASRAKRSALSKAQWDDPLIRAKMTGPRCDYDPEIAAFIWWRTLHPAKSMKAALVEWARNNAPRLGIGDEYLRRILKRGLRDRAEAVVIASSPTTNLTRGRIP